MSIPEILSLLAKELAPLIAAELRHTGDELLTVKQVAKQLRLGESTVRKLVASKALLRARDIADIRIRQSVVDAYGTNKTEK